LPASRACWCISDRRETTTDGGSDRWFRRATRELLVGRTDCVGTLPTVVRSVRRGQTQGDWRGRAAGSPAASAETGLATSCARQGRQTRTRTRPAARPHHVGSLDRAAWSMVRVGARGDMSMGTAAPPPHKSLRVGGMGKNIFRSCAFSNKGNIEISSRRHGPRFDLAHSFRVPVGVNLIPAIAINGGGEVAHKPSTTPNRESFRSE